MPNYTDQSSSLRSGRHTGFPTYPIGLYILTLGFRYINSKKYYGSKRAFLYIADLLHSNRLIWRNCAAALPPHTQGTYLIVKFSIHIQIPSSSAGQHARMVRTPFLRIKIPLRGFRNREQGIPHPRYIFFLKAKKPEGFC